MSFDPAWRPKRGRDGEAGEEARPGPAARPRTGPLYSLLQVMQTQSRATGPLKTLATFLDARDAAALSRTTKAATSEASIERALAVMRVSEPLGKDEPSFLGVSGHTTFPLDKMPIGQSRAYIDVPPKRWATDEEKQRHFDSRVGNALPVGYDTVSKPGLRNLTVHLQPGEARILASTHPMHLAALHVKSPPSKLTFLAVANIQADRFEQRDGCVYAHTLKAMKASVVDVDRVCVDSRSPVADLDDVEAFAVRVHFIGYGRILLRNAKKAHLGTSAVASNVEVCVGPEITHLTTHSLPHALSRGVEWCIPAGLVKLDIRTHDRSLVEKWIHALGVYFASGGESKLQVLRLPAFGSVDLAAMEEKRWPVLRELTVARAPVLPAGALPSLETLDIWHASRWLGFAGPRLDLVRLHHMYHYDIPSSVAALATERMVSQSGEEEEYTGDDTVSLATVAEVKVTVNGWVPPEGTHRLARCLEVDMYGERLDPGVLSYMLMFLSPRVVFVGGRRADGMGRPWQTKARVVNAPLPWLREVARLRGMPDHMSDEALLSHREELERSASVEGWHGPNDV